MNRILLALLAGAVYAMTAHAHEIVEGGDSDTPKVRTATRIPQFLRATPVLQAPTPPKNSNDAKAMKAYMAQEDAYLAAKSKEGEDRRNAKMQADIDKTSRQNAEVAAKEEARRNAAGNAQSPRIGSTLSQCVAKYGSYSEEEKRYNPEPFSPLKSYNFRSGNYGITMGIYQGKVIDIKYYPSGQRLIDPEINTILAINAPAVGWNLQFTHEHPGLHDGGFDLQGGYCWLPSNATSLEDNPTHFTAYTPADFKFMEIWDHTYADQIKAETEAAKNQSKANENNAIGKNAENNL